LGIFPLIAIAEMATSKGREIAVKTSWLQRLTLMLLVGLVLCVCTWAPVASAEDAPRVIGRRLVEPTIRLQPILAPATGSAAFYITEEWLQQVPFATGIFSA